MTDKELMYVEDAIGHEKSIIDILNNSINYLEEETLSSFMQKECEKHEAILKKLMKKMEECSR